MISEACKILPVHLHACLRAYEGQVRTGSQSFPAEAPPAWRPVQLPTHHGQVSVTASKLNNVCVLSFNYTYLYFLYLYTCEFTTDFSVVLIARHYYKYSHQCPEARYAPLSCSGTSSASRHARVPHQKRFWNTCWIQGEPHHHGWSRKTTRSRRQTYNVNWAF